MGGSIKNTEFYLGSIAVLQTLESVCNVICVHHPDGVRECQSSIKPLDTLNSKTLDDSWSLEVNDDIVSKIWILGDGQSILTTSPTPSNPGLHPDPILVVSILSSRHMNGLGGEAVVGEAKGCDWPTVQHWLHTSLALAVVAALSVDTLRGGEVTLGIGAFINIHTLGQVDKLLILPTRDDVGANQTESLVTADSGSVLVIVGLGLLLNETILDVGELEASLPGTVGYRG